METIRTVWFFIQNQILGMKWLNQLIQQLLEGLGLNTSSRLGGAVLFFLYDTIKILILHPELFPSGAHQKNHWQIPRSGRQHLGSSARNGHPLLLLFLHSVVHRVHQCRSATGGHLLLPDFLPAGRPRLPDFADECVWRQGCSGLCGGRSCACRDGGHSD